MKRELNNFFTTTISSSLKKLSEDTKPTWGTMTAKKMLIHLMQGSKMIHLENTKLVIKEKHIKKAIAFLYTNKPISRGIEIPKDISYNFNDGIAEDIEELKENLIDAANTMSSFLTKNTDFKSIHPFFGELNAEQWLLFQKKHFTHHLSQFGLL